MGTSKRHRQGSSTATAVGDLLLEALAYAGLNEQAQRLKIQHIWPAAVGPDIARRCHPHTFQRGTLIVKSTSAAWQNELTFLKDTIIRQVNKKMGTPLVKELRVISGSATAYGHGGAQSEKSAAAVREPTLTSAEVQATRKAAAQIPDAELREAFADMMAQALRSQHAQEGEKMPR